MANYDPQKNIDLTSMLPRWRRRPGGHPTSTGGLDPAREDALTGYELAAAPPSGIAQRVSAVQIAGSLGFAGVPVIEVDSRNLDHSDSNEDRGIVPAASVLTWDSWWELIDADWTITFRKPSRLKRSHEKFIQTAIDIIEERTWQAFGTRTDKLQKSRQGVILVKGAQAIGLHGLNKALAEKLNMDVRAIDQIQREIRALKRFPADTVLERVRRKKYI